MTLCLVWENIQNIRNQGCQVSSATLHALVNHPHSSRSNLNSLSAPYFPTFLHNADVLHISYSRSIHWHVHFLNHICRTKNDLFQNIVADSWLARTTTNWNVKITINHIKKKYNLLCRNVHCQYLCLTGLPTYILCYILGFHVLASLENTAILKKRLKKNVILKDSINWLGAAPRISIYADRTKRLKGAE